MSAGFEVITRHASCRELAGTLVQPETRALVVGIPSDRSVVLGSMQRFDAAQVVRAAAEGFGVTRRRSGGGGVVIEPDAVVWVDLFLPVDDPHYVRDIREGAYMIGEWWVTALVAAGCDRSQLAVHRGAMTQSLHTKSSCFAGLGPGEVTLGGRKITGISQRRDRTGVWYFTLAYLRVDPPRDAHLLADDPEQARALELVLRDSVGTPGVDRQRLTAALTAALSDL